MQLSFKRILIYEYFFKKGFAFIKSKLSYPLFYFFNVFLTVHHDLTIH